MKLLKISEIGTGKTAQKIPCQEKNTGILEILPKLREFNLLKQ